MADREGSGPYGRPDVDLTRIRRLATRKRVLGQRVRRVLPGLIVGSATLAGTGTLAAWVGHQPGIHTVPSAARIAPTTTVDALGPLASQLHADEQQVNALQSTLANLQKQRAAEAAAAGQAPTGVAATQTGSPGAAQAGSSIGTLPPLPPIPSVSISPAPVVNATTGASHAVP